MKKINLQRIIFVFLCFCVIFACLNLRAEENEETSSVQMSADVNNTQENPEGGHQEKDALKRDFNSLKEKINNLSIPKEDEKGIELLCNQIDRGINNYPLPVDYQKIEKMIKEESKEYVRKLGEMNGNLNDLPTKADIESIKKAIGSQDGERSSSLLVYLLAGIGGIVFIQLIGIVVLFIRTKKGKEGVTAEQFNAKMTALSDLQKTELKSSFEQLGKKIPSISPEGISSGVVERMKEQFKSLQTSIASGSQSGPDKTLKTNLDSIKSLLEGELKTLRAKVDAMNQKVSDAERMKNEAESEKAEAQRMKAEAQRTISTATADRDRAVEVARTEKQLELQKGLDIEKAKMNAEVQRQIGLIHEYSQKIEQLTRECAELKVQVAASESKGYGRGCKEFESRLLTLSQEKGSLEARLAQSHNEVQRVTTDSMNNKKQLEQLKAELVQRGSALDIMIQQKNAFETKVSDLRGQLSQAQATAAEEQRKVRDAENRAGEALKQKEELQSSVGKLMVEKKSLQEAIVNRDSSIMKLTQETASVKASLVASENMVRELQAVVYPAECLEDADFAVLKEHLDLWISEKIGAAQVVKSALGLFSQRLILNSATWQQALRNISLGISQTMRARKESPEAVSHELILWSKYLMKFADENIDFSLQVPNQGDNVDTSWMKPLNAKIIKVGNVVTWAVWNQYGVVHNAEVE